MDASVTLSSNAAGAVGVAARGGPDRPENGGAAVADGGAAQERIKARPRMTTERTKVALVGSGFIADVHLQVLARMPAVVVVALVDPVLERAERLGRRHGIARAHRSVAELLAAGNVDAAHVLVPPPLHAAVAGECLRAGLHVLVEKPLCLTAADADALAELARQRGRLLGVNHNLLFHPAVMALKGHIAAGRLGRLEHLALLHNTPLRQLQNGDVEHFLCQAEANILFEQGVHLFAVVHDLLGSGQKVQATAGDARDLGNGARFFAEWDVWLRCERGTASVRMAFDRAQPETTLQAIGSDGAAFVDLVRATCTLVRKTRALEVFDQAANLLRGSVHFAGRAVATVVGYATSLFGLSRPTDPFLRSMARSLGGFHAAVLAGRPAPCPPAAAKAVVQLCLDVAAASGVSTEPMARPSVPAPGPARPGEIVVLGGNGFVGRHCVQRLLAGKRPVTLLVRRPHLLPAPWRDGSVRLFTGDAGDPAVLQRAFAGASAVLHLATAAGDDPLAVATAMPAAVRAAGEAALAAGVRRFVYASSTAALWLGGSQPVTGATPTDPWPAGRGGYARGKIAAEAVLVPLRARGLDVVIVRPAIVLGAESPLQHAGIGQWVRDNHCVGWGRGRTPLPLLLADDCARALVAALDASAAKNRCYNLAGGVRLSARELLKELRRRSGRDLHFHGRPVLWLWLQEVGKYAVKMLARRQRQWPQLRDLRSRSCRAPLDCSDAMRDLGWQPEDDRERFLQRLFGSPRRS
jgi:predicted dehydrogenase/nucleoside-diphosphate-sugar epimerase